MVKLPGAGGNKRGRSESRTLLASVLLSAPGPIVIGLGLLVGRSSTQIADFLRRTAELAAIVCGYVIYRITATGDSCDEEAAADDPRDWKACTLLRVLGSSKSRGYEFSPRPCGSRTR